MYGRVYGRVNNPKKCTTCVPAENKSKYLRPLNVNSSVHAYFRVLLFIKYVFARMTTTKDFTEPIDKGTFKGVAWSGLQYTKHFVGVLSYLMRLHWWPQNRESVALCFPHMH